MRISASHLHRMTSNILFVGGGLTGALAAAEVQSRLPQCDVHVWDKGRRAGGRMTTSLSPMDPRCKADLGAQYVSTTLSEGPVYETLLREGLLQPLTATVEGDMGDSKQHYVAPDGMGSLVERFLSELRAGRVQFSKHVTSINQEGDSFMVSTNKDERMLADVVVCTVPVPQLLTLQCQHTAGFSALREVRYSSRFALLLFFDSSFPLPPWGFRYLNHPVFRFVALDCVKRGRPAEPPAVVLHTSVPFALQHDAASLSDIQSVLLQHVQELFPAWPQPQAVKCHRWRYSQVQECYPGAPGALVLNQQPLLLVGGDGFSQSNVDGCIFSAHKISDIVVAALKNT